MTARARLAGEDDDEDQPRPVVTEPLVLPDAPRLVEGQVRRE